METRSPKREYRRAGEVRTFAIRQTRMTDGQRRALETLAGRYVIDIDYVVSAPPGAAVSDPREERPAAQRARAFRTITDAFSQPSRPLILEIGFGMGEATAEFAARRRGFNILGAEVHRPGVGKLLLEIERRGLENLEIVTLDAVTLIRDVLADECLHGVHVFFPDPWPKTRHHKRRLIQPEFLRLLARRVAPGGYLYLVTDWPDYADQMTHAVSRAHREAIDAGQASTDAEASASVPRFCNPHGGFSPPRAWRPTTSFESKAVAKGHSIYELFLLRR